MRGQQGSVSHVKPGNTEPTVSYPAQGIVRWTETGFYPATNSQVSAQAKSVLYKSYVQ